jgi:hypothetical protein
MDEVYVHHLTPQSSKRARVTPLPPAKRARRQQQARHRREDHDGEISFTSARWIRKPRTAHRNNHQLNINPPPLPLSGSDFQLHTPPGTPHQSRSLSTPTKSTLHPTLNFQLLAEPETHLFSQSVSHDPLITNKIDKLHIATNLTGVNGKLLLRG